MYVSLATILFVAIILWQFAIASPWHDLFIKLNSVRSTKLTEYFIAHKYCAHRMYIGIKEVRMKKPKKRINIKWIFVFWDYVMMSQFKCFIMDSIQHKILDAGMEYETGWKWNIFLS